MNTVGKPKTDNTRAERQRRFYYNNYAKMRTKNMIARLYRRLYAPYRLFDQLENDLTNLLSYEGSLIQNDEDCDSPE